MKKQLMYFYFIKGPENDTLIPVLEKKRNKNTHAHTKLVEVFHSVAKFFYSVSLNSSGAMMQILKQD